ncbi:protein kinase [uncultured Oscillibacter sp.]|uniref:protein kinase domain-containing protein n=1 Tax=uncultured Oscillibacter sp. TaxID=876091 RepID=UPI0026342C52|nr:protein kinase [uncultured Oscillibacter sp.]
MSVEPSTQCLCYNCFQARETQEGPCPYCGFDLEENAKKYPVALQAGTVLNDRYIIGRVLGQGGFGITYLALDTQLNAKVAIKEFMPGEIATRVGGTTVSVLAENRSEEFTYGAERFQEEARTLAKFIGNPNIAGVSSYFDENDTSYFVMDYIEGISFKTYIANHGGKISVEETLNIMIPVLRALTAVHAEGFIHRDVTPDNIYITKDGIVKLLDFGSARYSIGDKSKSLDVILKVGYAPKEQYIRRSRQGPFTDVYSCAACFYAAITGFLPPESLERLDHDELVPISQCGIEIPEYLDKAILKGLAVQPEDRFQSAAEFLNAIESQQVVEVPGAAPAAPTAGGQLDAFIAKVKQQPKFFGAIAAAVAVVLVAVGVFTGGGGGGGGGGRPLLPSPVSSITIAGQEYSTDERRLELENMGLTDADLEDLQYMVNLTYLNLEGNNAVTDISAVANMPYLENLRLRGTSVQDLSPLSGLEELRELQFGDAVWDTAVDLTPLATLTNLDYLSLPASMAPTDLSPLGELTNLTGLSFDGSSNNGWITDLTWLSDLNQIDQLYLPVGELTSLKGLEGATALTELNLYGPMYLTDLTPLASLKNLQRLYLYSNGTSGGGVVTKDLTCLSSLTRLSEINIEADGLESLRGIENLTELTSLRIYNSGNYDTASLRDISQLQNLTKLKELQLYVAADIQDFSPLSGLTGLTSLQVNGNFICSDYSFLSGLTELRELYFNGDSQNIRIKDLTGIQNLTKLQTLHLTVGALESLHGLENLTELTDIYLTGSGASFTDTAPLQNLTKVKTLRLPNRGYDVETACDLSGLAGMTSLQEFNFSGKIKSLEPLAGLTSLRVLDINDQARDGEPALDLSPLASLKGVTDMTLQSQRVSDVSPVGQMTGLRTLYLGVGSYEHPLRDISALSNLTNLSSFTASGWTEITDTSPVAHVANVTIN